MDEPTSPRLRRLKARISPEAWQGRVKQAELDEVDVRAILGHVERGRSLNAAIAEVLPKSRRSWAMHKIPAYRRDGLEALIDARQPREAQVSRACLQVVQAARMANPTLTVEEAFKVLEDQRINPLPHAATIKREFARVDARRRYAVKAERAKKAVEIALPFAGGELLAAAEQETGGIAALTDAVVEVAEHAKEVSEGQEPERDVAGRSGLGQFTATYNRRRKRKRGEVIAPYLRTAEEKAEGRVPSWPRFVHEDRDALAAKLWMLTVGWIASGKGWEGLRAAQMTGLAPLTGYAYMPSTLAKMVSAMAISGLGPRLLRAVGEKWHEVAEARWQEAGAMAALYIDNHAKEVWSDLFTLSGKVSHRNRVMPCITTTYAHTGAGTPVVLSVQSGSAPLAPRLVDLVDQAEETLGGSVRRALVIDAEGSTFDILSAFDAKDRVIVTPLRPSRAPELELRYSQGSYYRPYRDNDELRIASCTLVHKTTGRSLELGALLVRRPHHENDIVLLTTGTRLGCEGRDLADLYFSRWPLQENAFKDSVVLGNDRHRGNCGRMVANVAVITELEQIEKRLERTRQTLAEVTAESSAVADAAVAARRIVQRARSLLATRRRRFDALIAEDKTSGKAFTDAALEHQQALAHSEQCAEAAEKAAVAAAKNVERRTALEERMAKDEARCKKLEPQRTIRQLDVAQDMILTATKLTAAQLISFAIREYLPSMKMTAETFCRRVFSIQGRKEIEDDEERVFFYENPRDKEVTEALRDACRRLNQRKIQRAGRRVHYAVAPAPDSASG